MSREGMFSNYPLTMQRINKVNRDHQTSTEVLDFQMVQNLGTYDLENLHALLTGYVDQGSKEPQHPPTDMEMIFGLFKSKGYQTAVHESGRGCWSDSNENENSIYTSKLAKLFLKSANSNISRQQFEESLTLGGVGTLSSTSLASCFLFNQSYLSSSSSSAPSTSSASCCTDIYQFEQSLSSLWMLLSNLNHHKLPSLSLLLADNPLPSSSMFDGLLVEFVDKLLTLKNSITIITASKSSAGEASLPLFVIVPGKAKATIPDNEWQSLVLNQDRLISLLDLHTSLRYMLKPRWTGSETQPVQDTLLQAVNQFRAKYVPREAGLFNDLSSLRHCDNMPRTEFACLCLPDSLDLQIDNRVKLLGLFGCELLQGSSLCGCTSLNTVAATKLTNPGEETLENLVSLEMENRNRGLRALIQINIDNNSRRLKVRSLASNLNCRSELSKEDDILDHIDDKVVADPGIKKTVESLYTEGGVDCLFLVELSIPGLSTVQLVNTCPSEIELKLEFRTESAFYLNIGEYVCRVGAGRLDTANVFYEKTADQHVIWEYSLLEVQSIS